MKKIIFIFLISNIFLTSCNTFRESAGVNRKVIDEYTVIENPPLIIPPDFNLLPPEQIQSKNIEETDTNLAKEILFGLDENISEKKSDNSLISEIIKETEADKIDPNIRDTIDKDFAGQKSSKNDEIIFENQKDLNEEIDNTEKKDKNLKDKKEKKKKRFFFF
tara:strand:+ start:428 stop:916 length:489 start_codon:yes stop_codon:yes gene_type:complete